MDLVILHSWASWSLLTKLIFKSLVFSRFSVRTVSLIVWAFLFDVIRVLRRTLLAISLRALASMALRCRL